MNLIITGVTRGLGRAMASEFSSLGHTVVGCARNESQIREMQEKFGSAHHFAAVDISDVAAVKKWSKIVLDSVGVPDLVLNNAGVINSNANLWQVPPEEFQQVCDVNLVGTYATIRAFLPPMIERGSGGVVNFSSTWGHSTSPEVAPYCATKWGVEGLTRSLASELPPGLFAVALNPGVIYTEMLQSCFGSGAANYPQPEAWANSAVPFILGLRPSDNGSSLAVP